MQTLECQKILAISKADGGWTKVELEIQGRGTNSTLYFRKVRRMVAEEQAASLWLQSRMKCTVRSWPAGESTAWWRHGHRLWTTGFEELPTACWWRCLEASASHNLPVKVTKENYQHPSIPHTSLSRASGYYIGK